MAPSKKLPPPIRNHIMNHRIPVTTSLAVFVIYPDGIRTHRCPIGFGVRCAVDLYRRHHPGEFRYQKNVFVNSWSLKAEHVPIALKNLHLHARRDIWKKLKVVILIYAHASKKFFNFNGVPLSIPLVIRSCNAITSLSVLGLLGCNTASANIPKPNGYQVFGFTGKVDYEEIARYAIGFVNIFNSFLYRGYSSIAACNHALYYSYTVNINAKSVWKFSK